MTYNTCSGCGLQFESTGRSMRCPSCGTKVRGSSGTLPPLPAGLQHHSTAAKPHHEHGDFQAGKFLLAMAFAFVAMLLLLTGILNDEMAAISAGLVFAAVVMLNGLATSFWYDADGDGLRRLLIELPFYIVITGSALVAIGVVVMFVYAIVQITPALLLFLIPAALFLMFLGPPRRLLPEIELRLRMHGHPDARRSADTDGPTTPPRR